MGGAGAGGTGAGGTGAGGTAGIGGAGGGGFTVLGEWAAAPALPEPIANNAVAAVNTTEGDCVLLSAYGIDATLAPAGIHRRAYSWREGDASWQAIDDVPVAQGRIAASAVGLRNKIYVLGGYSVAANFSETTHDEMRVFDPSAGTWSNAAPLPLGVDDAAVVVWRERYIVVISGWSNAQKPVDAVQIYDADNDSWVSATPFPGFKVFGHSAAIDGDSIVVIDGTGIASPGFALFNQAWRGTLDPDAPATIVWSDLGGHPPPARYRAAATLKADVMLFHGGTDAAYNFNGLAYADGQPAAPLATTLGFSAASNTFGDVLNDKPTATMDHRGMPTCEDRVYTVGGMRAGPVVTDEVWRHSSF